MASVTIEIDTQQVLGVLAGIPGTARYKLQQLINNSLVDAQREQYGKMRTQFTIRNEAFLKNSIRINFAKRDLQADEIQGSIYVANLGGKNTSNIWKGFEAGDIKKSRTGGKVAIPTDNAWPNRGRVKPQRNKPRNLKQSFITREGSKTFVFERKGKRKKKQTSGRDSNVKLMYILKDSAKLPRRLYFYDTVTTAIMKHVRRNIERTAIDIILTSARRGRQKLMDLGFTKSPQRSMNFTDMVMARSRQ
jgi:hypothetical protein